MPEFQPSAAGDGGACAIFLFLKRSIGGAAIAFAAQKTLEQLLGTIVLYLDRPFVPGDHIRVSLNPHAKDVYGRIESIGLCSTKLRTAAKSTLVIIPNSTMANLDIENITRGKKVMVLLYLDFVRVLEARAIARRTGREGKHRYPVWNRSGQYQNRTVRS